MKKLLGIILMGQSPSNEKSLDYYNYLSEKFEVHLDGLLDDLPENEIEKLYPSGNENFILSTLRDGKKVKISECHVNNMVNDKILKYQSLGYKAVLIFCTGHFEISDTSMMVIVPERLILYLLKEMKVKKLGIMVPCSEQIPMSFDFYKNFDPVIFASDPYGSTEDIATVSAKFKNEDIDIILADCMGYSAKIGAVISENAEKDVLLPRIVIPKIIDGVL